MSQAASTIIGARVQPEHAEALRAIADRNASTVSRTVARIIERHLASQTPNTPALGSEVANAISNFGS